MPIENDLRVPIENHIGSERFIRLRVLELVCSVPAFTSSGNPEYLTNAAAEFERFIIQGNR